MNSHPSPAQRTLRRLVSASRFPAAVALAMTAIAALNLTACAALRPSRVGPAAQYALDLANNSDLTPPAPPQTSAQLPVTLLVTAPRAASGFDSGRIAYRRELHGLHYYAQSEWIDTPPRMLAPLIASALENSGRFEAVVRTPSAARADISVSTELLRLEQDFSQTPSVLRITLHVEIVDLATRRVLGSRQFDEQVTAATEDAAGGVRAANLAVQRVLTALTQYCAAQAQHWQPAPPAP